MRKKIKDLTKEDMAAMCERTDCLTCPLLCLCRDQGFGALADKIGMIASKPLQDLVERDVEVPEYPHTPTDEEKEDIFRGEGK